MEAIAAAALHEEATAAAAPRGGDGGGSARGGGDGGVGHGSVQGGDKGGSLASVFGVGALMNFFLYCFKFFIFVKVCENCKMHVQEIHNP